MSERRYIETSGGVFIDISTTPVLVSGAVYRKSRITFEIKCSKCFTRYWDVYPACPHCGEKNVYDYQERKK